MIYEMIKKKIEPSPTALEPGDGGGRATGVDGGRATIASKATSLKNE
jgi:hypothetical protein